VLAAAVRQIVEEVTPVLSFFSRFTVLSSVKSHYLLTYNQRFVEIIKVSTDSYISLKNKMHAVRYPEFQLILIQLLLMHVTRTLTRSVCTTGFCEVLIHVCIACFAFVSTPCTHVQSVYMYKMVMLVFHRCLLGLAAPRSSTFLFPSCASSTPRTSGFSQTAADVLLPTVFPNALAVLFLKVLLISCCQ